MKRSAVILSLIVLTLLGAPAALFAQTFTECSATITTLAAETSAANFFGQNADKDRAGLLGKLSAAQLKLDQGKFADAIQKLGDFRSKVATLSSTGKLDATDAASMLAGADAAIACIRSLSGV